MTYKVRLRWHYPICTWEDFRLFGGYGLESNYFEVVWG
jgi:hypothetical protein